jgi:alpha-beta hydrolase superfamily lysophospholipase
MNFQALFNLRGPVPKLAALLAFCGGTAVAGPAGNAARSVQFTTEDDVVIAGTYRPAAKPGAYTFILLHGLGSTKEEWEGFEQRLIEKGWGYFAYDARGHGASMAAADATPVDYRSFGAPGPGSAWSKMPGDLARAVRYLKRKHRVRPGTLIFAGASLGANVALIGAAQRVHWTKSIAPWHSTTFCGSKPARWNWPSTLLVNTNAQRGARAAQRFRTAKPAWGTVRR